MRLVLGLCRPNKGTLPSLASREHGQVAPAPGLSQAERGTAERGRGPSVQMGPQRRGRGAQRSLGRWGAVTLTCWSRTRPTSFKPVTRTTHQVALIIELLPLQCYRERSPETQRSKR